MYGPGLGGFMVNKNLDKIFSDIKQPQIKDNFEKWNLFLNNEVDF